MTDFFIIYHSFVTSMVIRYQMVERSLEWWIKKDVEIIMAVLRQYSITWQKELMEITNTPVKQAQCLDQDFEQ